MSIDIKEHLVNLNLVNYKIAELKQIKEDLEQIIINQIGRGDMSFEGQKTHEIGRFKVEVTTDYNYKINKTEYEIYKHHLPQEFDPVISEVKYRINKKAFKSIDMYGSEEQKLIRDKFITLEPAKPSVKIRDNV